MPRGSQLSLAVELAIGQLLLPPSYAVINGECLLNPPLPSCGRFATMAGLDLKSGKALIGDLPRTVALRFFICSLRPAA